jgi:hypothetical protein
LHLSVGKLKMKLKYHSRFQLCIILNTKTKDSGFHVA